MANLGIYGMKNMLDWSLKTTTPATPANCAMGVSIGVPTSAASSEVPVASLPNPMRTLVLFHGASTGVASFATASNTATATLGTFAASQAVSGMFLSDTVSSGAGSMLWYGSLAVARTPLSGDTLSLAVGALTITLS